MLVTILLILIILGVIGQLAGVAADILPWLIGLLAVVLLIDVLR